jgi:kynurenine formamidase
VACWQGLPTDWSKPGDILLVRTGWIQQYLNLTTYNQEILPWDPELGSVGVNASDDSLAWLWEKKLALVGADHPAFESTPFDKTISGVPRSMHQVFIGGEFEILHLEGGSANTEHRLGTKYHGIP